MTIVAFSHLPHCTINIRIAVTNVFQFDSLLGILYAGLNENEMYFI